MTFTPEQTLQLKDMSKEAIDESFTDNPLWIDAMEHWKQHEKLAACISSDEEVQANRKFTTDLREGTVAAKKTAIRVVAASAVTAIIAGLVLLFTGGQGG